MLTKSWIAEKIISLAQSKNISINKLAVMSGIRQSTLNSLLKGESNFPRLDTLAKIADALGVSISDFLKNIEDETDILK